MRSEKYENQVFKEEVTILKGSPTFENCVFEKGVYVKGNFRRKLFNGKGACPVFRSCTFFSKDLGRCVFLQNRARAEFLNCKMFSENFIPIEIYGGSRGVFRNCSIGTLFPMMVFIEGSSASFEGCFFDLKLLDEKVEPCVKDEPCVNPVMVNNTFEEVVFSKCFFVTSVKIKGTSSFDIGSGVVSFDRCNFFYPKETPLVLGDSRRTEFNCCRFNIEFEGILHHTKNCSFEPDATIEDFKIGDNLRLDCGKASAL